MISYKSQFPHLLHWDNGFCQMSFSCFESYKALSEGIICFAREDRVKLKGLFGCLPLTEQNLPVFVAMSFSLPPFFLSFSGLG